MSVVVDRPWIQLLPPGDWEQAWVFEGNVERGPIVGWALSKGKRLDNAYDDESWEQDVVPIVQSRETGTYGDFISELFPNDEFGFVVPKGLSDDEVRERCDLLVEGAERNWKAMQAREKAPR